MSGGTTHPNQGATGFRRFSTRSLTLLLVSLTLFTLPTYAQIAAEQEDSVVDSLDVDSVSSTERFLKEQLQVNVRVPVLPILAVEGPRPALTRIVFTRDSIEWGHAATVSDLLTQVPGVFLWRGGYIGRPEPVSFQGRGGASTEYYLDGIPYVAAGVDSVVVDPSLFSLSLLDRIEVERWPGLLRVQLFTKAHDRFAPRSRIAIARGDEDFARYEASIERRFHSGLGLGLAADYLSSPTATGLSSDYSNTQVWVQGSYIPSDRFGVQYRLIRSAPKRDPYVIGSAGFQDSIGAGYEAKRTDAELRVSLKGRGRQGLGPRLDLIYGRTAWDSEGIDQQINQLGGYLSYRTPTFSVGASAFSRTLWTRLDVRASLGWNPVTPFTVRGELVHQRHTGDRNSDYANLAAGFELARGLAVTGTARLGKIVTSPSILASPEQNIRDYEAALGWNRARLGFQVAYARVSAFAPPAYAEFVRIPVLAPAPRTDWVTASARIAPLKWITFEGWYSDPRSVAPEGIPPTLSVVSGTIRSKFLRKFPSGTFDLKLRLSVENWGTGIAGRDPLGVPVTLRGATFFRSLIQFQLGSFSVYWDRVNLTSSHLGYVPEFEIPAFGSNFGVRWEFLN
ncbi:MAG TPA: TonB-dependent receptor [Gemmatimonadales bacterium]|nr:TonB-dependent receptor [Gemmatimonadales bacterium]